MPPPPHQGYLTPLTSSISIMTPYTTEPCSKESKRPLNDLLSPEIFIIRPSMSSSAGPVRGLSKCDIIDNMQNCRLSGNKFNLCIWELSRRTRTAGRAGCEYTGRTTKGDSATHSPRYKPRYLPQGEGCCTGVMTSVQQLEGFAVRSKGKYQKHSRGKSRYFFRHIA